VKKPIEIIRLDLFQRKVQWLLTAAGCYRIGLGLMDAEQAEEAAHFESFFDEWRWIDKPGCAPGLGGRFERVDQRTNAG